MAIDQNVDVDGLNVSGLYQGVQAMTANVNPYRRPRSNAVRAAVVTGMPRTKDISSSNSSSLCKTMPSVLSHDRGLT
jgi:hypothetical protein